MAGRQAKILTSGQLDIALRYVDRQHDATRNRVILLLSVKAGLRAGEIAGLSWPMLLDARGRVSDRIELHDAIAKCQSGRTIPLNADLRRALVALRREGEPIGAKVRAADLSLSATATQLLQVKTTVSSRRMCRPPQERVWSASSFLKAMMLIQRI
jgi:integrase